MGWIFKGSLPNYKKGIYHEIKRLNNEIFRLFI